LAKQKAYTRLHSKAHCMLACKCARRSTPLFECYKDAGVEVVVRALASAGA